MALLFKDDQTTIKCSKCQCVTFTEEQVNVYRNEKDNGGNFIARVAVSKQLRCTGCGQIHTGIDLDKNRVENMPK